MSLISACAPQASIESVPLCPEQEADPIRSGGQMAGMPHEDLRTERETGRTETHPGCGPGEHGVPYLQILRSVALLLGNF